MHWKLSCTILDKLCPAHVLTPNRPCLKEDKILSTFEAENITRVGAVCSQLTPLTVHSCYDLRALEAFKVLDAERVVPKLYALIVLTLCTGSTLE